MCRFLKGNNAGTGIAKVCAVKFTFSGRYTQSLYASIDMFMCTESRKGFVFPAELRLCCLSTGRDVPSLL